jgi:hypothetical protein
MRKTFCVAAVMILAYSARCAGQEVQPVPAPPQETQVQALPPVIASPSDRESYGGYESPREALRHKAEFRAMQRLQRVEYMKWLGYSPLRPPASPTPFMGSYSGVMGMGVHYPFPGTFYRPAMPTAVMGSAAAAVGR